MKYGLKMAAEEEGIELAVVDVEEGLDAEAQKKFLNVRLRMERMR